MEATESTMRLNGELVEIVEYGDKLSRVRGNDGEEFSVSTSKLKPLAPPKLTREEKARNKVEAWVNQAVVWAWAGWLAVHPARFRASAPENQRERESERLDDYGVEHEIGVTLTGKDAAAGASYTVVYEDFGFAPQFEALTGIVARPTEHTQGKLSTQQWEPVLVFLLGDMKFKLTAGKPAPDAVQDQTAIRNRVPARFQADFDRGVRGEFSSYFALDMEHQPVTL